MIAEPARRPASAEPKTFGWALTAFALTGPLLALRGWVITMLWDWYIVPAFGTPSLRAMQVYGMLLIFSCLRRPKEDDESLIVSVVRSVGISLFALAFGWMGTWYF